MKTCGCHWLPTICWTRTPISAGALAPMPLRKAAITASGDILCYPLRGTSPGLAHIRLKINDMQIIHWRLALLLSLSQPAMAQQARFVSSGSIEYEKTVNSYALIREGQ